MIEQVQVVCECERDRGSVCEEWRVQMNWDSCAVEERLDYERSRNSGDSVRPRPTAWKHSPKVWEMNSSTL